MLNTFYITGTDTGAGKTVISCGLLEKARQRGLSTVAVKPVASGCKLTPSGLRNTDALALMNAMSISLPYNQVNPFAFQSAIAPHIAAFESGVNLSLQNVASKCRMALSCSAEFALVEGAGGWKVPLAYEENQCLSILPKLLNIPVILVVNMRLGCINHARLTAESIISDGACFAGWVANQTDDEMLRLHENIETLKAIIPGSFLGFVPHLETVDQKQIASYISLDSLINTV